MGTPFPVLESYLGFMRDAPRHQLPGGILWDMLDWIPDLDGAARRRNGWATIDTQAYSAKHTGAQNKGIFCGYAPFSGGAEVLVSSYGFPSATNSFYHYNPNTGGGVYVGEGPGTGSRPMWHREKLLIPASDQVLHWYTGAGAALVAGTGTPWGLCGTLFGDYAVLANTEVQNGNRQRVYFSAAGDPTSWDLTNSWIDVPGRINGVQGVRGLLLVFTESQIWRVRGDTPPQAGVVGNLIRDHLYDTGLVDERSIATYGEEVVFANSEGVWITDGAQVLNLTELGGIATYWRDLLKNFAVGWGLTGGVFHGYYIVSVHSAVSNTAIDTLVCDLSSRRWFRLSGLVPTMFAHSTTDKEHLFFTSLDNGIVGDLATIWNTPSTADANGTVVRPSLETPFFRGWQRFHRKYVPSDATSVWQRIYASLEAPGTGGALRVAYTTDPAAGAAYTTVGDLATGTGLQRHRLPINPAGGAIAARGIAFKIYQDASMSPTDLRLDDLELEYFTREGSR